MKFKVPTFKKDFYAHLILTGALVTAFCSWNTYKIYTDHINSKQECLQVTANQIIEKLEEEFSQLNDFMAIIGKQICDFGNVDLDKIYSLIEILGDESSRITFFKGMSFGWITKSNKLLYKFHNNLIDMTFRPYLKQSQETPWMLHFSPPSIGMPEGLWEIPGGMGIVNDEGHFLGTLAVGINVAELNSKIQQLFMNIHPTFVILDKNYNIILQSFDNGIDPKSNIFKNIFKNKNLFLKNEEYLSTFINYNNIQYEYIKQMGKYPYIILLGYNGNAAYNKDFNNMLYIIMQVLILIVLLTFLFYLLHKKKIKLILDSHFAVDRFRKNLIASIQPTFHNTLEQISLAKKYIYNDIKEINKKAHLESMFNNIVESIKNFAHFSPKNESFIDIDVNAIIKECVLIQSQKLVLEDIKIYTQLKGGIPPFQANELCFKQLIVGLISLCADYTPKGGFIEISSDVTNENDNKELVITFKDSGPALDIEDIIRIQRTFSTQTFPFFDAIPSNYLFIESLIQLHFGTCKFSPISNKGKTIVLKFPYNKKNDLNYYDPRLVQIQKDTVYH